MDCAKQPPPTSAQIEMDGINKVSSTFSFCVFWSHISSGIPDIVLTLWAMSVHSLVGGCLGCEKRKREGRWEWKGWLLDKPPFKHSPVAASMKCYYFASHSYSTIDHKQQGKTVHRESEEKDIHEYEKKCLGDKLHTAFVVTYADSWNESSTYSKRSWQTVRLDYKIICPWVSGKHTIQLTSSDQLLFLITIHCSSELWPTCV